MQGLRALRRTGRARRADADVVAGLACFVGAVYPVVVVGGGRLTGSTDRPSTVLSVAATAVVALAFDPVRRRLSAWTARWSGRPVSTPSQALRRFLSGTAAETTPEEATARMARALVDGLGVDEAQVWVVVGDRMRLAGAWPEPAGPPDPPDLAEPGADRRVRAVRHRGELLGAVCVRTDQDLPLAPVEEQLLDGLTASAGLVLRNLRLAAELQDRYREVRARAAALTRSRRRVAEQEDEERRLLERDIHDGAQQQLVALAVNLRVVQSRLDRGIRTGADLLADLSAAVDQAQTELLAVVCGRERLIATAGLDAALRAVADTCPVEAHVVGDRLPRYAAEVEQALFYCCAEALQNVAKHARARGLTIELRADRRGVRATVRDDGDGFTPPAVIGAGAGSGLRNIAERIAAIGGSLAVQSAPGAGTRIELSAPATAVSGTS
jgi:signal transduction histidine kinase